MYNFGLPAGIRIPRAVIAASSLLLLIGPFACSPSSPSGLDDLVQSLPQGGTLLADLHEESGGDTGDGQSPISPSSGTPVGTDSTDEDSTAADPGYSTGGGPSEDPGPGDGDDPDPNDPPDDPPPPSVYRVAGRVLGQSTGVPGVVIESNDGLVICATDSDGVFEFPVTPGWSGVLRPEHRDYEFEPQVIELSSVIADRDGCDFLASAKRGVAPGFAVRNAAGNLRAYPGGQTVRIGETVTTTDTTVHAELSYLGGHQWKLRLTANRDLIHVWFPYDTSVSFLGEDSADDAYLIPGKSGRAQKVDTLSATDWNGPLYPGKAFAPLLIHTDREGARMYAAINWPPIPVKALMRYGQMGLQYSDAQLGVVVAGETRVYRALVAETKNHPALGIEAWRRLTDTYKTWLHAHMTEAGLYPVAYPDWIRTAHGWMAYKLNEMVTPDYDNLSEKRDRFKHLFSWVQCWGQMGDYDPNACCLRVMEIHDRYLPDLLAFAADVRLDGDRIGYYAGPNPVGGFIDGLDAESEENLQWLLRWIEMNTQSYGANAVYIDSLGVHHYGDPLTVANLLQTTFPVGSPIEASVDIYPSSFLLSGALFADGLFAGGPEYTDCLDCFDGTEDVVTFPRLGRYLLGDRVVFLGTANHDWRGWGVENDYWVERQIFLLGAKFDALISALSEPDDEDTLNHAVALTIAERDAVDWWSRDPVYLDREGVHDLPPGVDVRRFVDASGVTLLAVDNWYQHEGLSFGFEGQLMSVPVAKLSILELP